MSVAFVAHNRILLEFYAKRLLKSLSISKFKKKQIDKTGMKFFGAGSILRNCFGTYLKASVLCQTRFKEM